MSLFCGDTCKCKRRCESFFPYNRQLKKSCKDACRSGADIQTAQQYIQDFVGEGIAIDLYGIDINPFNDVDGCMGPEAALDAACNPELTETPNYMPLIAGGMIILGLIAYLLIKK